MTFSEILNILLGGGVIALVVGVITLKATVRRANAEADRAKAEAEKAKAEADTVKITNTEHATRILIQNIVEPLKNELKETRNELKQENAQLRKEIESGNQENSKLRRVINRLCRAIEAIQLCAYRSQCPVSAELRDVANDISILDGIGNTQRGIQPDRQRKRGDRNKAESGDGATIRGDPADCV